MPSSTQSVTAAQLLVAGDGTRSTTREIHVRCEGAVSIGLGDETSQDFTLATGEMRTFHRAKGDDLWVVSLGAATEVEAIWTS